MLTAQEYGDRIREVMLRNVQRMAQRPLTLDAVDVGMIHSFFPFDEYEAVVRAAIEEYPNDTYFWLMLGLGFHFFCKSEGHRFELAEDAYDHVLQSDDQHDANRRCAVPLLTLLYWQEAKKARDEIENDPNYQQATEIWAERVADWASHMGGVLFGKWWEVGFRDMIGDVTPAELLGEEYYRYGGSIRQDPVERAVALFAALAHAPMPDQAVDLQTADPHLHSQATPATCAYCPWLLTFLGAYVEYVAFCRQRYEPNVRNLVEGSETDLMLGPVHLWIEDGTIYVVVAERYWRSAPAQNWIDAFMFLDRELGLNQFGYLVRHAQSGAWKPDDRFAYSTALGGFLGLYPELETSAETVQLIRESVAAGLCVADEGNPGWLSR